MREIASHKLLLRAGMIRKAASGVYTFLPLGKRVLAEGGEHRARGDGRHRLPRRS